MSGQLFLKIVEARNLLGISKRGDSDPIVRVSLEGENLSAQTECFRKTVNPSWNEEYYIGLLQKSGVLLFALEDYVRIFKNKPLGTTSLDIASLQDGVAVDMWLPVSTQGELRIIAQFIPTQTPRMFIKKLASFRMQVERSSYYPGEVIRGHVVYNVGVPIKIRGVRVVFSGGSRVSFNESRTRTVNGQTRTESINYSSYHSFFSTDAALYGNPKGVRDSFYIPSGSYFLPFQFVLPMDLPPSFSHSIGGISYQCKAYVDIPWGFDKSLKFPFEIAVEYASNTIAKTITSTGTSGGLFARSQNISVMATAPDIAYAGETQQIGLRIVNEGTKPIEKIEISLESTFIFVGRRGGTYKTRTSRNVNVKSVLQNLSGFPILPGMTFEGNVQLQVPVDADSSVPYQFCPNIQVNYNLVINAITKGNIFTKQRAGIAFSQMVGKRYPQLQHIIIPVQPVATPNVISISQIDDSYKYLAPPPMMNTNTDVYVGAVVSDDLFKLHQQTADQFTPEGKNDETIDPNQAYQYYQQAQNEEMSGYENIQQPNQPTQPQYGQPQYGQPNQPNQPQYGQPQYGQPNQPNQPQYVQPPQHGQPNQPQNGQPQYGQPNQPTQPQYGQPQYGQPNQPNQPQYVQPPPQNGQPTQPQYGQTNPHYGQQPNPGQQYIQPPPQYGQPK